MPKSRHTRRTRTLTIVSLVVALVAAVGAVWGISTAARQSSQIEAPTGTLPDATQMGAITLNVNNLEQMRDYYQHAVGLEVLSESEDLVELGLDSPLIALRANAEGEAFSNPTEAGLYHSAILYPTEQALAQVLMDLATVAPATYQGSADHAVSLAFYFVDPEGNGLELYVDRPRDEWVWQNGEVQMGSAPLDPNDFIREHLGAEAQLPDVAVMGHVHMRVGDLEAAEAFYADTLGFAVTARADGALFYSAGGYHHHLATNIWQSGGAGTRSNPTGLGSLVVTLPTAEDLAALTDRFDAAGVAYEAGQSEVSVFDPWGNEVRVTLP